MARDPVVPTPANHGAQQVPQTTGGEEQADLIQGAMGVLGQARQGRTHGSGRQAQDDEGRIIDIGGLDFFKLDLEFLGGWQNRGLGINSQCFSAFKPFGYFCLEPALDFPVFPQFPDRVIGPGEGKEKAGHSEAQQKIRSGVLEHQNRMMGKQVFSGRFLVISLELRPDSSSPLLRTEN